MSLTELLCAEEERKKCPCETINRVTAAWIPTKILSSVLATVLGIRKNVDFVAGIKYEEKNKRTDIQSQTKGPPAPVPHSV